MENNSLLQPSNIERFPENFMFQLNEDEQKELVTNCDRCFKGLFGEIIMNYKRFLFDSM